jgi:divalent metal cation (Fe/Co/Zn/Cd) transporter
MEFENIFLREVIEKLLATPNLSRKKSELVTKSVAKKYGLLSLRIDANNSIKDGTSSFVVFANVLGATILGIHELDAVAGMIISIYIFAVAYVAIKESSLTLLDACESPEMTRELAVALQTVEGVRAISSIRLRPSGPYLSGIISVLVDESLTVARTEQIRKRMLEIVRTIVEPIDEVTVVFRAEHISWSTIRLRFDQSHHTKPSNV